VAVERVVSPPLELVPAQELLGFLVVLLDPPPAVRILHHPVEWHPNGKLLQK
jgi:hypothetical protein